MLCLPMSICNQGAACGLLWGPNQAVDKGRRCEERVSGILRFAVAKLWFWLDQQVMHL